MTQGRSDRAAADPILVDGLIPLDLIWALLPSCSPGPVNIGWATACPHIRGGPCPGEAAEFLELGAVRPYAAGTFQTAWCPRHRWLMIVWRSPSHVVCEESGE